MEGPVGSEHFARLTEGQHPTSGAQLVRHQPAKAYENQLGREVSSVEHRAGWDATFSAPKSVPLTALVGGDDRVREAHRDGVRVAMGELERYTQARICNVQALELTGKFARMSSHLPKLARDLSISPPRLFELLKAIYEALGYVVWSLALLTFSGAARRWDYT